MLIWKCLIACASWAGEWKNLHASLAMIPLWGPGSVWHSVNKKLHWIQWVTDTSSLFTTATLSLLMLPLFTSLQKKRDTTVKTSYRQHDQYQPGRGCLISRLFFLLLWIFTTQLASTYISGKRQYPCILFRKSLVDVHSCLTEWQKYPWSLKLLV